MQINQIWQLGSLYEYWDQKVFAIDKLSRLLAQVPPPDRNLNLEEIRDAIVARANALSNEHLAMAAFVMSDDLFKAVSVLSYWDENLADYLRVSVGALLSVLMQRGFVIHYGLDNAFVQTPQGMNGPLEWYPTWYRTAGLKYICPQEASLKMMLSDGHNKEMFFDLLPRYIDEGRLITDTVVKRCHSGGDSYFLLDTDSTQDSFKETNAAIHSPGVIHIFRNDPPFPGSKCVLIMPKSTAAGTLLDHKVFEQFGKKSE